MPLKADYWKYLTVQGLLALCQIEGCLKPTVSLGSAPKNGGKKRISKSSNILASEVSSSLQKHHAEEWGAYCEIRKRTKAEVAAVKKEEVESCEMENSEVRFYDVRSSKGRLPFLAKVCFGKGYFMC